MVALTMDELALAYELRQERCSWQRIGAGLGCNPEALSKAIDRIKRRGLRKYLTGYKPIPGRPPRYHLDIVKKAHAMRLKGSSWKGIARELLDNDSYQEAERIRHACRMAKHYLDEESEMMKEPPMIGADFSHLEKLVEGAGLHMPEIQSKLLDLHTISAALFHGIQYDQVTPEQRRAAKTKNFMHMYTPGSVWKVPDEKVLMAVYSQANQTQLCFDFRLARPSRLYETLKAHLQRPR